MHDFDDLMFFISSFDSTIFTIGNVIHEDKKQCVFWFNTVIHFSGFLCSILHVLGKNIALTL